MKTAAGYKHHQQHNFYEGELAEEDVVEALVMLLLAVVGQLVSRESDKMEVRRSERGPRKNRIYCLRSTTIIILILYKRGIKEGNKNIHLNKKADLKI